MLPCRDPLSHRDHVHEGVAVRDDDVQDLLHHDLDQPDHQLPLPHGPLRRQIHRRLPPHLISKIPHRVDCQGDQGHIFSSIHFTTSLLGAQAVWIVKVTNLLTGDILVRMVGLRRPHAAHLSLRDHSDEVKQAFIQLESTDLAKA